jgi:hypothetical protein
MRLIMYVKYFMWHIVTRYSGSIHHEDAIGGGAKFVVEFPPGVIGPTAN